MTTPDDYLERVKVAAAHAVTDLFEIDEDGNWTFENESPLSISGAAIQAAQVPALIEALVRVAADEFHDIGCPAGHGDYCSCVNDFARITLASLLPEEAPQ